MLSNLINFKNLIKNKKIMFLFLIISVFFFYIYFISAPFESRDNFVHVKKGDSFGHISLELKEKQIIRNVFLLKIFFKLFAVGNFSEGDYFFDKNTPVYKVAWQLSNGDHNIKQIKVTLKEGLTNEDFAEILSKDIPGFDKYLFLEKTKDLQGYLFPDTYFFFPYSTTEEVVERLSSNFKNKTKNIDKNNFNLNDIIIMASILEGEASGNDDAPIISGILWKRLNMGMRLQVDVDPNTYKVGGLPSLPLNNPGMSSILSAINFKNSDYLYYLHDKNGNVYYAKNYEEHKRNINKYLR